MRYHSLKIFFFVLFISVQFQAQERPVLDIMLTNYEYPFPVQFLSLKSQNKDIKRKKLSQEEIKKEEKNRERK